MEELKEFIAGALLTLVMVSAIFFSMVQEDNLVEKHCAGLSGYEYGQCQASIY